MNRSVSERYDTLMHNAEFVELESSALGDAVRQYAVLELIPNGSDKTLI